MNRFPLRLRYALVGVLFGALFPLFSTALVVLREDVSAWQAQAGQPLLWVIDTAPFVLGVVSLLVGWNVERLKALESQQQTLLKQQRNELLLLYDVARHIAAEQDPATLADRVVEAVRQTFDFEHVALFAVEQTNGERYLRHIGGGEYLSEETRRRRFRVGKEGVIGHVAASGEVLVLNDVRTSPIYIEGDPSIRSELAVPLVSDGEVLGVLNIESQQLNAFDEDTVQLVRALADQVAVALRNARTLDTLRSERRRLAVILEHMADGLLVVDPDGRVVLSNPALEQISGVPARALLGRPLERLIGGEIYRDIFEEALQQPDRPVIRQFEFPHRPGLFVKVSVGVMRDETGAVEGAVAVVRDVTHEYEVDRMKTDFISMVSHELRTPLTSVLGFVKLIHRNFRKRIQPVLPPDDRRVQQAATRILENLTIIESEGQRLTRLINDVLDIAKLEAGRVEWHMQSLDVRQVVQDAVAATTGLFANRPDMLQVRLPDAPVVIHGDHDRLVQVVTNLISNAAKFTDEGHIEVALQTVEGHLPPPLGAAYGRPLSLSGKWVMVSVTDSGIGIAEDNLPKVFERFKQVGDTLTDRPKGTGLGLPICKEIVEHHQGVIWVESEPGRGSRFAFLLPLVPEALLEGMAGLVRQLEQVVPQKAGGRNTILVVDDEEPIRRLLSQELEEAGFRVLTAANGSQAIQVARQRHPDLIILDVMMPGLSGFDTLAVLKNDPKTATIPVMFLTIMEGRERGLRLGAAAYLNKPIDSQLLMRTIQEVLGAASEEQRAALVLTADPTVEAQITTDLKQAGLQAQVFRAVDALVQQAARRPPALIVLDAQALGAEPDAVVRDLRQAIGQTEANILVLAREEADRLRSRMAGAEPISDLDALSRRLREESDEG